MNMVQVLFYTHSGWRYLVLLASALALIAFIYGWVAKRDWSRFDQWLLAGYAWIITIQWLLGILLWITYPARLAAPVLEHLVTMTLALIPAHMGLVRAKRATDSALKYRIALIFVAISTALLWLGVARITNVL